jgi:hypothetical protein
MSYTIGTANDPTALRAAIFSACQADGWNLNGTVLSKGTVNMAIALSTVSTAAGLKFTGGTGAAAGALTGACPYGVSVGDRTNLQFAWPVTYRIFSFTNPDEVFVVLQYNVDQFQYAAWGKSVHALPGSGMWFAATLGGLAGSPTTDVSINSSGSMGSFIYTAPALFWRINSQTNLSAGYSESFIHHGLDGDAWTTGAPGAPGPWAAENANPLFSLLPNAWNSELVLLPIQASVVRPSNMAALVATLRNARYTRIDNHAPCDLVTLGAERWMVLPWLKKDSVNRNGVFGGATTGLHTGTLGWAIRYEGA